MDDYTAKMERQMKRLYDSLGERDRRLYAAVEAEKLGHGGLEYIAKLLGCEPKIIGEGSPNWNPIVSEKKGGTKNVERIEPAIG